MLNKINLKKKQKNEIIYIYTRLEAPRLPPM